VEVAGDESSSHAHLRHGRASRSLLEFPSRWSNSAFGRTAAAMAPGASARRGFASTSTPFSYRLPPLTPHREEARRGRLQRAAADER
jgi:hypothetical protein